jgi:hypothetical protein
LLPLLLLPLGFVLLLPPLLASPPPPSEIE